MLKIDGDLAMLVMPAAYRADLTRLSRALGGNQVELAREDEFKGLFPDCEPGAMPPFGRLFELPLYCDKALAEQDEIEFNAGTHTDTIRMWFSEFARIEEIPSTGVPGSPAMLRDLKHMLEQRGFKEGNTSTPGDPERPTAPAVTELTAGDQRDHQGGQRSARVTEQGSGDQIH